jgi:transcriptional regulator with XRE-family HTH domain
MQDRAQAHPRDRDRDRDREQGRAQERGQPSRPLLRTMLGEVLRRTRLEQGRTLADVARHARVSMPYLSELERGRKEASSEVLAAICGALGLELSDLLAQAGRALTSDRARPAPVIRLESIRDRPAPPQRPGTQRPDSRRPGPGDVTCRLAA